MPKSHLHLLSLSRLHSRIPAHRATSPPHAPSAGRAAAQAQGDRPTAKITRGSLSRTRLGEKGGARARGRENAQSANRCNLIRGAGRPQDFPESRTPGVHRCRRPPYGASPAPGLTYHGARALLPSPALAKYGPRGGRSLPGPATGTVTERPGDRASATARDTYLGEGRRRGA